MSGPHGGYGVAAQISGQRLQDILTILHRAGQLPSAVNTAFTVTDPGDPGGSAKAKIELFDAFLDVPRLNLGSANSGGQLELSVRLAGRMRITSPTCDAAVREIRLALTADATLTGQVVQGPGKWVQKTFKNPLFPWMTQTTSVLEPGDFKLVADFSAISVPASGITVLGGPPLPPLWKAWFSSPVFRALIALFLISQLDNVPIALPGELVPAFNALRVGDGTSVFVETIIGVGFVTFGIDVTNSAFGVNQNGNSAGIAKFLSQSDIAAAVDEGLVPLLNEFLLGEIAGEIDEAEVTSASLAFGNGYLTIAGHAEATAGSADFSMRATPVLGRPDWVENYDDEYGGQYSVEHDAADEIWMDISHLELDADLAWWAILGIGVGALLLSWTGPGQGVLASIVNDFINGIRAKTVKKAQKKQLLLRRNRLDLGLPDLAPIDIVVSALQVFPDRIQARMNLIGLDDESGIQGPSAIAAGSIGTELAYHLVASSMDWHPDDPEVRIRWTLRCMDTNQVLKTVEYPPRTAFATSGIFRFRLSLFGAGTAALNNFRVSVRVYRSEPFDYFNDSVDLHVNDRLDRSRRYVQWQHRVYTPNVQKGGAYGYGQWRQLDRTSRIHRTDVPGRCRFADKFSYDVDSPDYLDQLPFRLSELAGHRREVCDYCFYGGPTRTKRKPLPGDPLTPLPDDNFPH